MNEKLKRKLAEWAGFQWLEATDGNYHWFDANGDIVSPTDEDGNVIWGMDACFEWLVPKLTFLYLDAVPTSHINSPLYTWAISQDKVQYGRKPNLALGEAKTPALALCLALEKLIDGGK